MVGILMTGWTKWRSVERLVQSQSWQLMLESSALAQLTPSRPAATHQQLWLVAAASSTQRKIYLETPASCNIYFHLRFPAFTQEKDFLLEKESKCNNEKQVFCDTFYNTSYKVCKYQRLDEFKDNTYFSSWPQVEMWQDIFPTAGDDCAHAPEHILQPCLQSQSSSFASYNTSKRA